MNVLSAQQAVPEATFDLFPDEPARSSFAADLERAMHLRLQSQGMTELTASSWQEAYVDVDGDPVPVRVLTMEGTAP